MDMLKLLLLVTGMFYSQPTKDDIVGCWYEVSKPKYLKLDICFNLDSSAIYVGRYPEQSLNLKYIVKNDTIKLSNNCIYLLQPINSNMMYLQMLFPKKERKRKLFRVLKR